MTILHSAERGMREILPDEAEAKEVRVSAERPTVLVIDDEATMRDVLRTRLEAWGYRVEVAEDAAGGERAARQSDPWLVLADVVLPDANGVELLERLRADAPGRAVILITAYGTVDVAVEAMKLGARDFLTKPLDYRKLRAVLDELRGEERQRGEARQLDRRLAEGAGLGALLGVSRPMRELFAIAERVAESDASALLTGESGTGKELLARTIHELSARAARPFVAVNAAALPEGLTESELFGHERGAFTGAVAARPGVFEQAHGGTLFLDEIAEMPVALQPKLLRALEERQIRRVGGSRELTLDVRLLAATNRDARSAIAEGGLRADLFYRLSVFTLHLPPLRERPEDVALLAQQFVRGFNARHGLAIEGFAAPALELLRGFSWPGNVRELRNVVERAAILAREGWIAPAHLPPYVREPPAELQGNFVLPPDVTAAEAERRLILETLERVDYNKAEAARRLGLDVKTIRNRLHAYGLKVHRR
jgi:DNA-binding NtrC family response regulator